MSILRKAVVTIKQLTRSLADANKIFAATALTIYAWFKDSFMKLIESICSFFFIGIYFVVIL